jgi:hypothetical protein
LLATKKKLLEKHQFEMFFRDGIEDSESVKGSKSCKGNKTSHSKRKYTEYQFTTVKWMFIEDEEYPPNDVFLSQIISIVLNLIKRLRWLKSLELDTPQISIFSIMGY